MALTLVLTWKPDAEYSQVEPVGPPHLHLGPGAGAGARGISSVPSCPSLLMEPGLKCPRYSLALITPVSILLICISV